jgi:hypothetical protein
MVWVDLSAAWKAPSGDTGVRAGAAVPSWLVGGQRSRGVRKRARTRPTKPSGKWRSQFNNCSYNPLTQR